MPTLTTAQAAQRFKIRRFTLGRAVKYGLLSNTRDNKGGLLYDEDELTAWLNKRPASTPKTPQNVFILVETLQWGASV